MRVTEISSKSNVNIKQYKKLSENKRERAKTSLFTLEGLRLFEEALKENLYAEAVFFTEKFIEKNPSFSEKFPDNIKLFLISDEIAACISQTENPQGIFALCRIPENRSVSDIIRENGKYVFLSDIQDPGNMGTIIRTADALGIDGIICCGCTDIYTPKPVRAAMGSIFRMKTAVTDENTAFSELEKKHITTYAACLSEYSERITDIDFKTGSAVLIGNEGNGLKKETADRCMKKIIIPMRGRAESLNASAAAAIIMWELTSERERLL